MRKKARRVKRKFVTATEREVRVGLEKDSRENIVAEKYMRELKPHSCWRLWRAHAMVSARRFPPVVRSEKVVDRVCSH